MPKDYMHSDEKKVNGIYDYYNESTRLSSKGSRVEYYTTIKEIEEYLKDGMKILDLGAGTGEYSIYFAEKGYDVTSLELVEKHVDEIKSKVSDNMNIEVFQGNALDLSRFEDNSFDIVLCFGPLYHLEKIEDKIKVIEEIKRISKDDGILFFAFISNDMVIVTETFLYTEDYLLSNNYDHDTFKVADIPFVFHTIDSARELLKNEDIKIISEVAVDGFSELLKEKINAMSDEEYNAYLNYHYYISKKPEFLGVSNHLLLVGKK